MEGKKMWVPSVAVHVACCFHDCLPEMSPSHDVSTWKVLVSLLSSSTMHCLSFRLHIQTPVSMIYLTYLPHGYIR